MKKFLKILLITLAAILIILIVTPFLFRSRIEAFVKKQVNENIEATVDWKRIGITLFRGFPDLSVNLHQFYVIGIVPFEGDTLAGMDRFELRLNLLSVLKDRIEVKEILLNRPVIRGIVKEDGTANWDIVPEKEPVEEPAAVPEEEEPAGTVPAIQLERFAILDGRVSYRDAELDADARMEGIQLELKGDFAMDLTDLVLSLRIGNLDATYGGIRYLRDGQLLVNLDASADLVNQVYTLKENEIRINGLVLGAEGQVSLPADGSMVFDLRYFSRETSFHTLLSLVPAIFLRDFQQIRTSGSMQLEGTVNGIMKDSLLPDATLRLKVSDGAFSYPDLPGQVTDVQVNLDVDFRGTEPDLTRIDLNRFHFLVEDNPFDMALHVTRPISDPHISGKVTGFIDFSRLKEVIPLENIHLEGTLESNLSVDTRLSYFENEQYEEIDLAGNLSMQNLEIETPDLPVTVEIHEIALNFTPRYVSLDNLSMNLGDSDLLMQGRLTNFIPYLFNDQVLSGSLQVTSEKMDVSQLLPETGQDTSSHTAISGDSVLTEIPEPGEPASETEAEPLRIPENIDFTLQVDFNSVIYSDIFLQNVQGIIRVHEGSAILDNLALNVLEGRVVSSGQVDTQGKQTAVNLDLDVRGIDIPASYETFMTVEKLAPMAKYCRGTANVNMKYASLLNASFTPVYTSINADGHLFTRGLQIYNLTSFVRLSELLKNERFREMAPDEVDVAFRIRDGRVIIDPFDMHIDHSLVTVSGSHGIDQTMDYRLDMKIARTDLGSGAGEMLNGLEALAAGAGIKVPDTDYINVKARITGTFGDPKVTTDLSGNLKSGRKAVQEQVEEKVREELKTVEAQVRDEGAEKAEKIISEAEAEADRIVAEAKKKGEELEKEAARQGENLIREAGNNPVKKIAAQKAAAELKRQASIQSDRLVKEAEEQAEDVIRKAREEASKLENPD